MSNNLDAMKALDKIGDMRERDKEGKPAPMAMCPVCKTEPLIFTFDRPRYEFHCWTCKDWFGFLDPIAAEPTPEIETRLIEVRAQYAVSKADAAQEPRRE